MSRALSAALLAALAAGLGGCTAGAGAGDSAATAPARRGGLYRDVAGDAGIRFAWGHASRERLTILDTLGHGCAFLDYDGDGREDVLLVGAERLGLFRNEDEGRFKDVTDAAFPGALARPLLHGAAVADYDADGRPDVFVSGYGRTVLYHNEGGTFRDVTAGSGLAARGRYDWTTTAAWADVDGDGRLDLYVCRYLDFTPQSRQLCPYTAFNGAPLEMTCGPQVYEPRKGSLYRNLGGGRFRDVTAESGLHDQHGRGLGAQFCDVNEDGRPDLYVANDGLTADFYLNLGGGRFRNIGPETGAVYNAEGAAQAGMGIDWGDYDRDGRLDLVVATFDQEPKSLYRAVGKTLFSDQSYQSGIGPATLRTLAFGAVFTDTDNDTLLDLVFTNGHVFSEVEKVDPSTSYPQVTQLFRNRGNGSFVEATGEAGPDFQRKIVGRGIARGDYDQDGRQDLLVVDAEGAPLLLRNEAPSPGHWLSLRCLTKEGGTDAIGARVRVRAGGKTLVTELRAAGSFLSTDSPILHFGLGEAARADELTVRWPDGRTTTHRGVAADRAYRLTPGAIAPL